MTHLKKTKNYMYIIADLFETFVNRMI